MKANPASKLLLHILARVAQFERGMIRERVEAGHPGAHVDRREARIQRGAGGGGGLPVLENTTGFAGSALGW